MAFSGFFANTTLARAADKKERTMNELINTCINGDALRVLKEMPSQFVDCCVTSPPYYALRDYGVDGQIGIEETPDKFVENLKNVFHEVKRVLKDDGTLWLNIGDCYCNSNGYARASAQFQRKGRNDANANDRDLTALHNSGFKTKDLIGIPWMLAFALRTDGWYLRQDIIWHKPNPMPESVRDRCTKAHEYIFLLSKSPQYYYDADAIKEPTVSRDTNVRDRDVSKLNNTPGRTRMAGLKTNDYEMRNKRDVWTVSTKPLREEHYAAYPEELIAPCILAGCRKDGIVLDPFFGSGTTGRVAGKYNRNYIGIELNPEYVRMNERRTKNVQMELDGFLTAQPKEEKWTIKMA